MDIAEISIKLFEYEKKNYVFFQIFVSRQEEQIQILGSARGKLIALKNEPNT